MHIFAGCPVLHHIEPLWLRQARRRGLRGIKLRVALDLQHIGVRHAEQSSDEKPSMAFAEVPKHTKTATEPIDDNPSDNYGWTMGWSVGGFCRGLCPCRRQNPSMTTLRTITVGRWVGLLVGFVAGCPPWVGLRPYRRWLILVFLIL